MALTPLPPLSGPRKQPKAAKAVEPPTPPVERYEPLVPLPKMKPRRNGWGAKQVGRWFEVGGKQGKITEVGGVCGMCGVAMPGKELRLFIPPFAEEAVWACGPCRKEARGVEWANSKKKEEVRRTVPKSKRVKNVKQWDIEQERDRDPLVWRGPRSAKEEQR